MRARYFALPASVALAAVGVYLMIPPAAIAYGVDSVKEPPGTVRHYVTSVMSAETARHANALLPTFRVLDSEKKSVELAPHAGSHPQFVYFILDGCPCSYDAEPLFHKLFNRYKGNVDFCGVTDADLAGAHQWSVDHLVNYPIVPDPQKKIIHAYGARASVYSTLIGKDGHVIKMWPGYSAGLLQDMNATMAKAAGVPERPFDPEYAPKVKATGCAF